MKNLVLFLAIFISTFSYAQTSCTGCVPLSGKPVARDTFFSDKQIKSTGQGGAVFGAYNPAATALLDLTSTTKGFLFPRMTTTNRDAITSPATGLFIYNTSTNALNYFNGTAWTAMGGGSDWLLTGNAGTIPSTNFVGTTDGQTFVAQSYFSTNNYTGGTMRAAKSGTSGALNLFVVDSFRRDFFRISALASTELMEFKNSNYTQDTSTSLVISRNGGISFNHSFGDNYTFPTKDGNSGEVLATNGAGVLSWQSGSGILAGDTFQILYKDSNNNITGDDGLVRTNLLTQIGNQVGDTLVGIVNGNLMELGGVTGGYTAASTILVSDFTTFMHSVTLTRDGLLMNNGNSQWMLPLYDGAPNQTLKTDGSGIVTWQDETGVSSIPFDSVTGVPNFLLYANNGLSPSNDTVQLGGNLTKDTYVGLSGKQIGFSAGDGGLYINGAENNSGFNYSGDRVFINADSADVFIASDSAIGLSAQTGISFNAGVGDIYMTATNRIVQSNSGQFAAIANQVGLGTGTDGRGISLTDSSVFTKILSGYGIGYAISDSNRYSHLKTVFGGNLTDTVNVGIGYYIDKHQEWSSGYYNFIGPDGLPRAQLYWGVLDSANNITDITRIEADPHAAHIRTFTSTGLGTAIYNGYQVRDDYSQLEFNRADDGSQTSSGTIWTLDTIGASFYYSGFKKLTILNNGNVGIGASNPASKLITQGSDFSSTNFGVADAAGVIKFKVTNAGAVQIVDGTQGTNKIFTSDNLGNGSWQIRETVGDTVVAVNGATTTIVIPHGLGANPIAVFVQFSNAGSDSAFDTATWTWDITNITITLGGATGLSSVNVIWNAKK